jgi:hypothetical protein
MARFNLGLAFGRGLMLAVCSVGLAWAICALPNSQAIDEFRSLERELLRSKADDPRKLALQLQSASAQSVGYCDTHAQTALLLMEMRLAEVALRAGQTAEFDQHSQAMESRSKRVLECAPRQSFVWLLAFSLEIMHGRISERSLSFLSASYETSPNEGWIAIRRNIAAVPLLFIVPRLLQEKILAEFTQLVRNRFLYEAAASYRGAPAAVRELLKMRIERLDVTRQKEFWGVLQELHP